MTPLHLCVHERTCMKGCGLRYAVLPRVRGIAYTQCTNNTQATHNTHTLTHVLTHAITQIHTHTSAYTITYRRVIQQLVDLVETNKYIGICTDWSLNVFSHTWRPSLLHVRHKQPFCRRGGTVAEKALKHMQQKPFCKSRRTSCSVFISGSDEQEDKSSLSASTARRAGFGWRGMVRDQLLLYEFSNVENNATN